VDRRVIILSALMLLATTGAASADPISLIVAAVSTASTVITGGAFIFGVSTAWAHFAITAGLGFAQSLLAPKAAKQKDRGYQINSRGGANPHAFIYGEVKVGGSLMFEETTSDNKFLHRVLAMAGHECESFQKVYFDDEEVTLDGAGEITAPSKWVGKARVKLHLGDQTVADSDLVSDSAHWTSTAVAFEICYIYVRFLFDREAFPTGPPEVTALIQGRLVFDPDTSTTAYSDNAVLCARDYFTAPFGLGVATASLNDTANIIAAAVCDESVALNGGGTQSRYTCNGTMTTASKPREIVKALHSAMAGFPVFSQGEWQSVPGSFTAATKLLTEDDCRGFPTVSPRHNRAVNFNEVVGQYRGAETNYIFTEYEHIASATFLAEDNARENVATLDLNFTDTTSMAQRIAKIALYRNREQISFSCEFGLNAFDVGIGEVVQFTYARWGWSAKDFEVVNWTFKLTDVGEPRIMLSLREISSGVFDWSAEETVFLSNNTTLPDPNTVPALGLATAMRVQIISEKLSFIITATSSATSEGYIQNVDIEYKLSSDSTFTVFAQVPLGRVEIPDLENQPYDVRVRARNIFGAVGAFTTNTNIQASTSDLPEDVGNPTAYSVGPAIALEWDASTDASLSYYIVRHAIEETAASWSHATTAVAKIARPATTHTIPAKPGTYMIRAVTKFGVVSENVASSVVRDDDLEVFATTSSQTEETTFSGTKTNCVVTSNELRITTPVADETATYDFSTYIDTGSVRRVRSRIDITVDRFDSTAGLFDDLTGLFDSLAGQFDDLTGAATFADTNVQSYISHTDDDPAGSPTWTAYKLFFAGDFTARAFRFRVVLSTTALDVTPSISGLTARVQY